MAELRDYQLTPEGWVTGGAGGKIAIARRGRATYRLKLRKPYYKGKDARARAIEDAQCRDAYRRLVQVRDALRRVDPDGEHMAYSEAVFDEPDGDPAGIIDVVRVVKNSKDLRYFEAEYARGDHGKRLRLLTSLTEAVRLIHQAGVRHGDLKVDNVLFVPERGGVRAVVIDFDRSTLEGDVPDIRSLGGTEGYVSQEVDAYMEFVSEYEYELGRLNDAPDDPEYQDIARQLQQVKAKISCKSDIYALGVIFHRIMTGTLPAGKADAGALSAEPFMVEMIDAMLCAEPDERPDCEDVLKALESRSFKPQPAICDLWPVHAAEYQYDMVRVSSRITRVRRCNEEGMEKYHVRMEGGSRIYDIRMMKNLGYVTRRAAAAAGTDPDTEEAAEGDETLWPKDQWFTVDTEALHSAGFVKLCRYRRNGLPIYRLYREDGSVVERTSFQLVIDRLLRRP